MNFITGKHLSRRTFLQGMGTTVALPLLDAMVPAGRLWRDRAATDFTRFVGIEESMGCAGGSDWGDQQFLFAPEKVGRDFEFGRLDHRQHSRREGRVQEVAAQVHAAAGPRPFASARIAVVGRVDAAVAFIADAQPAAAPPAPGCRGP